MCQYPRPKKFLALPGLEPGSPAFMASAKFDEISTNIHSLKVKYELYSLVYSVPYVAMKAGEPGSSPGRAKNFLGRGYWHILVIQLLGGP